jgi:hypothetical protein
MMPCASLAIVAALAADAYIIATACGIFFSTSDMGARRQFKQYGGGHVAPTASPDGTARSCPKRQDARNLRSSPSEQQRFTSEAKPGSVGFAVAAVQGDAVP